MSCESESEVVRSSVVIVRASWTAIARVSSFRAERSATRVRFDDEDAVEAGSLVLARRLDAANPHVRPVCEDDDLAGTTIGGVRREDRRDVRSSVDADEEVVEHRAVRALLARRRSGRPGPHLH
jgi:hypothetical protein